MANATAEELALLSAIQNTFVRQGFVAKSEALDSEHWPQHSEDIDVEEKKGDEAEDEKEEFGLVVSCIRVSPGILVVNLHDQETEETKTTTLKTTASANAVRTAVLRDLGLDTGGQNDVGGILDVHSSTLAEILLFLDIVAICECFRSSKIFSEVARMQLFWERLCERDVGNSFGSDSRAQYIEWYSMQVRKRPRFEPPRWVHDEDDDDDDFDDDFFIPRPGPIPPPLPGGDPWY